MTLSARDAIRHEYGGARNFMTPDVLRVGKIDRDTAYELARGSGLEPGSTIYGVSIVRILDHSEPRTERDFDVSSSFRSRGDAEHYIEKLTMRTLGRRHGRDAASWLLDGNSTEEAARRLLRGIEDGDPVVLDELPTPPSGEWAGEDTAEDLIAEAGLDVPDDPETVQELWQAYSEGFGEGAHDGAETLARDFLGCAAG